MGVDNMMYLEDTLHHSAYNLKSERLTKVNSDLKKVIENRQKLIEEIKSRMGYRKKRVRRHR